MVEMSEDREPVRRASPNTLVLLGAGASVDAGLPASAELHRRLCEELPPLYQHLSEILDPSGLFADPELVFRALSFLHAIETGGRPDDRRDVAEPLYIAQLVQSWHEDVQEYLSDAEHTRSGSRSGYVIDALWDVLRNHLNVPPVPGKWEDVSYLRDLLSAMRGQTVVTLNYDNALEVARTSTMIGLEGGPMAPNWGAPGVQRETSVRLIRLHGSLDWVRHPQTGDVCEATLDFLTSRTADGYSAWLPATPGIIFGAGNKLRPDGPYLTLYAEFKEALSQATQVVVIGYSFKDPHVNEALRRWVGSASADSTLRINVLTDDDALLLPTWQGDMVYQRFVGTASQKMRTLIAPVPRMASRSTDADMP